MGMGFIIGRLRSSEKIMIRETKFSDLKDTKGSSLNYSFVSNNDDSITLNISDLSNIHDESFMTTGSRDSKDSKAISVTMHDFDSDFDSRPSEGCHYAEALISREMGRDTNNAQSLMNEILNDPEIRSIQIGNLSEHSSSETEARNIESDPPSEHSDQDELPRRPSISDVENADIESQEYIRRAQHISPLEQNYIDRVALLRDEFDRRDSVRVAEIERVHNFYRSRMELSEQNLENEDRRHRENIRAREDVIEEQDGALREYNNYRERIQSAERAERERIAHDIMMLDKLYL